MLDLLLSHWHPSWDQMPWKAWTSPAERYQEIPSFVFGEFLFIGLALANLVHALKQGRLHVMVWVAAFVTGSANDAFFMALPIVDNFWQSQASIMLTPRMPLYIPCVYNVFMYTSTVSVWRLRLPVLAEAALTGIMGEIIYAPYDITGAKFVWWTWHDTDAPIRYRNLGAPVGSTVWVITFTGNPIPLSILCLWPLQLLLRLFVVKHETGNGRGGSSLSLARLVYGGLLNALLSTPIMMVQMAILQAIVGDSQGLPSNRSLYGVLAIYLGLVARGWFQKSGGGPVRARRTTRGRTDPIVPCPEADWLPKLCITLYFVFLTVNMAVSAPEKSVSTGVHQTVGPCDEYALDLAGQERQVYLCASNHGEQDFTFDCPKNKGELPAEGSEWYTVCGTPHSNWPLYLAAEALLGLVGIVAFRVGFMNRGTAKKID